MCTSPLEIILKLMRITNVEGRNVDAKDKILKLMIILVGRHHGDRR